jgi:hypothetical protein
MNIFNKHVNEVINDNLEQINIINISDREAIANSKNIEEIFSKYPTDLFKMLFSVLDILSEGIRGVLLYEVINV